MRQPIIKNKTTRIIIAIFDSKFELYSMLKTPNIPTNNNGIPITKENNDRLSPRIFPPCVPDSVKYLSDFMTVLSFEDVFLLMYYTLILYNFFKQIMIYKLFIG